MSNFIITGATGFVGSRLARKLMSQGHTVNIIARKNSKYDNIMDIKSNIGIFEFDGEISNMIGYFKEKKPDIVIHVASLFISENKPDDVSSLIDSNVKFPTQVLEAMNASDCKYLINTSTSFQHFNNEEYNPTSLYAATKQAFEDMIKFYSDSYNIKSITLELFDTYGPDDNRPKILNLLGKYSESKTELKMSEGNQILDLAYIDDIVEAYLQAINLLNKKLDNKPEKYNLASNNRMKLREIVELYQKITNRQVFVEWGARPYREREIMIPWNEGDVLPGWSPKISIEEGIKKSFL